MKTRNAEAARLEEDYLARIGAALVQSGRSAEEAAEVADSVREHIQESVERLPEEAVSLSTMAAIIEQLGPPQAYVDSDPAPVAPPPAATPPIQTVASTSYPSGPFSFSRVWGDAVALYTENFLPLLLASIIVDLLSTCTLFILLGPLTGGVVRMTRKAIDSPGHKIDVGDIFSAFNQFWPLLLLCIITVFCILLGTVMCIVPGIILSTFWFTPFNFMVERRLGVIDSLRASAAAVMSPGNFLPTFLLSLTTFAITIVGASIPYISVVLLWLVMPLFWFIMTLTYIHQTRAPQPATSLPATPTLGLST